MQKVAAQLPLVDYQNQVVEYSLTLKKAENTIYGALSDVSKSKTLRLPTLSLSGSYSYNMRKIEGQKQWNFGVQPQLTQTIYGGGGVSAEIDSYKLKHEVAICDINFTYLEVIYAANYAYWNLVATRRYKNAMREYVETIKSLKSVIDRRFNEGYISKSDVLMMATRLSEAEYSMVAAEQSYAVALHNFNTLRGVASGEIAEPIRADTVSFAYPKRVPLSRILEQRPDYIATQLTSEIYKTSIRSTKATYNPSLKAGVGVDWYPYTPNYTGKTRVDGSAFLQLSATLFHFGERQKALSSARASYANSQLDEAILYDAIEKEEANGWITIIDTHAQLLSISKSLDIASENLEISTYSYGEGQTTILEVMQAQLSWIQIYTNAINAEFNYLVAVSSYNKIVAEMEP
ncbi:MAG: TolC family protein [Rikenellaceae bacterium]